MVDSGSSMVRWDLKNSGLKRKGLKEDKEPTTLPALSRNKASMVKRINKEWIQFEGAKTKASWGFKDLRFNRPTSLFKKESAIRA